MKKLFSSKNEKGQGLIEYAIILALVAIVVIAVMRILGPKIGNTFSTINASLNVGGGGEVAVAVPTATQAPWTWCANDGGTCTITGTKEIQYGTPGKYIYTTKTGTFICHPDYLGGIDPNWGVVKSCYYR